MQPDEAYGGETKVIHYLELLRDTVGFGELAKQVKNPLKGRKIAAYYGCLLLRPGSVLQMDNRKTPPLLRTSSAHWARRPWFILCGTNAAAAM